MFTKPLAHRKTALFLAGGLIVVALLLAWSRIPGGSATAQPQAATPPKPIANSIGMKLVLIPSGEFVLGSPKAEEDRFSHEGPQQKVRISKSFYMGVYEVTQAQYVKVMGENPARYRTSPDHPVEQVTWEQAIAFCQKLTELPAEKEAKRVYRLPTEAEWEYACRGGTSTAFHVGEALTGKQANFDRDKGKTTKVGSYEPNAFGLYDMHGNVWEWCQDWFDGGAYENVAGDDPTGAEAGDARVIRGGGWYSEAARCRSAARDCYSPAHRFNDIGFRVVCSAPIP